MPISHGQGALAPGRYLPRSSRCFPVDRRVAAGKLPAVGPVGRTRSNPSKILPYVGESLRDGPDVCFSRILNTLIRDARTMTPPIHRFAMLAAILVTGAARAIAQKPAVVDVARLQQLLTAEDARGTGSAGVAPLLDNMRSRDTLLRKVAARGIGRLQRPELGMRLLDWLGDPIAAVRIEAANGIAQSLRRVRPGAMTTDATQLSAARAQAALLAALRTEREVNVAGAIAEALGRLPVSDSVNVRAIEAAVLER